jgi:hypothetical protein
VKKIFMLIAMLLLPVSSWGACTASPDGLTHTCADASRTEVAACITAASEGDTVVVPAGTATWTSTITVDKRIHIKGNGVGSTVITAGVRVFTYSPSAATISSDATATTKFELEGFSFIGTDAESYLVYLANSSTTPVKRISIHDNLFQNAYPAYAMLSIWGNVYGVAYKNTFRGYTALQFIGNNNYSWCYNPFIYGTINNFYVEDCEFYDYGNKQAGGGTCYVNSGQGSRFCLRYNTVDLSDYTWSIQPLWDWHGNDASSTGSMGVEIYGNAVIGANAISSAKWMYIRGGEALAFYNKWTGTAPGVSVGMDITFLHAIAETSGAGINCYTTCGCQMEVNDTYLWSNYANGSLRSGSESTDIGNYIAPNVNYWNYETSFTGATGLGCGTLAQMNAITTCTNGTAFWVTDQSCSDLTYVTGANTVAVPRDAHIEGTLYRCANNAWVAYYSPYTYPHPLREDVTADDVPVNIPALIGVLVPALGATPATTITASSQYTGTITWAPTASTFAAATGYTATITLTKKPGFTFTGVTANYFTVAGTEAAATNPIGSGNTMVVTAHFPDTAAADPIEVNRLDILGVTPPVTGATPVTTATVAAANINSQYSISTVAWKITGGAALSGNFLAGVEYTATITLSAAKTGYTYTGVDEDAFEIAGAATDTNAADLPSPYTITVTFAATATTDPQEYFVDAAADDDLGSGLDETAGEAFKSLTPANAIVQPGDIVNIKQGTYATYIAPARSGTAVARITYQSRATNTAPVIFSDTNYTINLNAKSYITVAGTATSPINGIITGANGSRVMMYLIGSSYNDISYCNFTGGTYGSVYTGNSISESSQYNRIHHCTFSAWGGCNGVGSNTSSGDLLTIGTLDGAAEGASGHTDFSWYNLIEDCTFTKAGHSPLTVASRYNTIRNNYIHNEPWKDKGGGDLRGMRNIFLGGVLSNTGYCLIEGNRIGYASEPCNDANPLIESVVMSTDYNIFRYNEMYHSANVAIVFSSYNNSCGGETYPCSRASYNKVYNNTMYDSDNYSRTDYPSAVMYFPQLSNDSTVGWCSNNIIKNNLYYIYGTYAHTGSRATGYGQTYENNWLGASQGNPLFANASIVSIPDPVSEPTLPNLSLLVGSPCIDAGGPLTYVATAGYGAGTLTLDDVNKARYFQDGSWAPAGTVSGDWIYIGIIDDAHLAQVTAISGATLTLSKAVSWLSNAPIWLAKKSDGDRVFYGTAPDVGALESNIPDPPIPTTTSTSVIPTCSADGSGVQNTATGRVVIQGTDTNFEDGVTQITFTGPGVSPAGSCTVATKYAWGPWAWGDVTVSADATPGVWTVTATTDTEVVTCSGFTVIASTASTTTADPEVTTTIPTLPTTTVAPTTTIPTQTPPASISATTGLRIVKSQGYPTTGTQPARFQYSLNGGAWTDTPTGSYLGEVAVSTVSMEYSLAGLVGYNAIQFRSCSSSAVADPDDYTCSSATTFTSSRCQCEGVTIP